MNLPKHLYIALAAVLMVAVCTSVSASTEKRIPKVDNFIFLFDASGSMRDSYMGQGVPEGVSGAIPASDGAHFKFTHAQKAMLDMNEMIPELDYQAGLFQGATTIQSAQDMQSYDSSSFAQAIEQTDVASKMFGNTTPLADGIQNLESELKNLSGETAVIVFTDGGANQGGDPARVVERLSAQHNTCFHIVSYAQSMDEKKTINAMADARDCTVMVSGEDMQDEDKMQGFVQRVFYSTAKDSDGDGVYDEDDQCPDTPAGVEVDEDGCPVDSDGDGVPDYKDKCPDTEAGAEVDDEGCPYPVSKRIKVYFDFDKAEIKDKYHDELKEMAQYLSRNQDTEVVIEGHTDSTGPAEYNMGLSERRAESVKDYLTDKLDIDASRLDTKGYGETRPVADNSSKEGRQKNRRVIGVVSK
ncbi:MAG: OmpA family protein [Desulfovermiculus sp.]